MELLEYSR